MAPHYYVRPDELCDAERLSERDPGDDRKRRTAAVVATPWEKRERRVFARYSPFCHGAGIIINKTEFTACPRVHFAWLGYNYTEVNDIPLDIAITLGDEKEKLLIKPGVPYQDFGKARYVVVADGWVRRGPQRMSGHASCTASCSVQACASSLC